MFEFLSLRSDDDYISNIIRENSAERITDEEFIELEISRFKVSQRRKEMIDGEKYYEGKHDILKRQRTIIGENGKLEVVENLPNNRIVDNQYGKIVDQKKNYLLGQPVVFNTDHELYGKSLKKIFNKRFQRLIKNVGEDSLNCGIGWIMPFYNEHGEFTFKRFKPYEIIPGWADADHTYLDYAIRIYEVIAYEGRKEKVVEKVEVYDQNGIYRFILEGGKLVPDEIPFSNYFTTIDEDDEQVIEQGWNWQKIPLIPWKYNAKEIPLIRKVKSLQDGLNLILSNFQNNMEEDARNTIMILVNYDGQNLGEFRKNLATYGAVKVKTIDGTGGDVRTLQVEVNAENYRSIIEIFKKAIIENAKGYDAKDDRMSGEPNQMNIQSMYSDIELDANEMETEYQASFEDLLWFVHIHFFNAGLGDFEDEEVEIIFNRDMMISESEVITNIKDSVGILSDEALVAQHPWVDDPQTELERIALQKEKEMSLFAYNPFNQPISGDEGGVVDEE